MQKAMLFVAHWLIYVSLFAQAHEVTALPTSPQLKSLEDRKAEWAAQHHIILNVVVRDPSGAPVHHLLSENVTLLDGTRSEPLQSFRELAGQQSLEPVHGVLVFDTIDTSTRELMEERKALEAFLTRKHGLLGYPLSLAVVTDAGAILGQESQKGEDLVSQLRALPLISHMDEASGTGEALSPADRMSSHDLATMPTSQANAVARAHKLSSLNRRFKSAVPALLHLVLAQQDLPGRCVLVWLGQGWPLLSESEFVADSPHARQSYFESIVAVKNAIRESQTTVYNVSLRRISGGDQRDYKNFVAPVHTAEQAKAGNLSLQVLSLYSGGDVMDQSADFAQEIAACFRDAESHYVIAFDAHPAATTHEYHSLQVKIVGRPDVSVANTQGYYDEP
ncbi:MAG: VWA domain-containing protein [Janthinobacterium lividum]